MGLKEVLSKMKIVELEPDLAPLSATAGAPAAGSGTDISDLLGSVPPPPEIDEKALARHAETVGAGGAGSVADGGGGGGGTGGSIGGAEIPDFAAVYSAAGISDPAHGYSAFKVLEILNSPDFANLDSRAKAAALAGFLKMNPSGAVPIADVVQDAVRRDQALDKFEDFLRTKLKARTEQIEKENRDLQAEIDALALKNREKMETNRKALTTEEERLAHWQVRKRIEERRLFDAVSPFVETNPITTGDAKAAEPPPHPAPE